MLTVSIVLCPHTLWPHNKDLLGLRYGLFGHLTLPLALRKLPKETLYSGHIKTTLKAVIADLTQAAIKVTVASFKMQCIIHSRLTAEGAENYLSVNKEHKDRVFKFLFGNPENREWTLALYNAVNGSDYKNPDDIQFNTLEDAVYLGLKNDISFIINLCLNSHIIHVYCNKFNQ